MNDMRAGKPVGGQPLELFSCSHGECGATFTRQWKLKEHETVHTGAVRKIFNHAVPKPFFQNPFN